MRPRLTYANVVSSLALFLVLAGGAAYAANTVFSSDIVDGQVKTPDLANGAVANAKLAGGAVTSDKVADESLRGRDVLDNALRGADIDEWTLSSIGGGGPAGGDLTGESSKLLGGGAGSTSRVRSSSRPTALVPGQNNGTVAQNLTVYVLCVL